MKRPKLLLLGGSLSVLVGLVLFFASRDSDASALETIAAEEPNLLSSYAAIDPQTGGSQTGLSSSASPRSTISAEGDVDVLEVRLATTTTSQTEPSTSQVAPSTSQVEPNTSADEQDAPPSSEPEPPEVAAIESPTDGSADSSTSSTGPAGTDPAATRTASTTPPSGASTTTTNPTPVPATSPTTMAAGKVYSGAGGPIQYTYETEAGDTGTFYSDRDCGWSTPVSGINKDGQAVSRALWAFCDSVGYEPDSGKLWSEVGVLSSSYGLAQIGANPTVDGVISPTRSDGAGNPLLLDELLSRPEETCTDSEATPYPREWARGMITLPDNDPTIETVLVFYQNFCIDFRQAVDFGAGGVALVQWDANNPDGTLRREKLNDQWFLPGRTTDERSGAVYPSFSYGSGPLLASDAEATYLYSYLCGAGGDCSVARVSIDTANSSSSARRIADTANWRYLSSDGDWVSFPSAEAWGTCAPTVESRCGDYPAPQVVVDADRSNILSTSAAEPSFKSARGKWYLLYSAGLDDGRLAYRVADSPTGPFSEPRLVTLGAGHCAKDCRAAFWQPSADRDGLWAVSYYDEHGLDGLVDHGNVRRRGRLMVTYVDPAAFR